jgi:multiphosphoryl transfer protein
MVGIVVVSHSRALADAAVELAREMAGEVPIAVAAGLEDGALGTDAAAIAAAVEGVGDGGVVVLMDLGSAVLSAELALELLPEELRSQVVLCPGPLVEGLVVAAVAASGGAARDAVAAQAAGALAAKQQQLGAATAAQEPTNPADAAASAPMEAVSAADGVPRTGVFTVTLPHGLHARPAGRLVQAITGLDAEVTVRNVTSESAAASARSMLGVATLGAYQGHEVEVAATGPDAQAAVDRVLELAEQGFGEGPAATAG